MGEGRAAQPDPEGVVLSLMPTHSGLGLRLLPLHTLPGRDKEPFPGSHVTGYD